MDVKYCVYKHTSPSGKSYVGISLNPKKRWAGGRGYVNNYRFSRAINKYGWDAFAHEILYENLSIEEAKDIERRLISEMNLTDFRYGYNLRDGGDGSFSEESRKKMSLSRIGNHNNKNYRPTEEQMKKISDGLKRYYSTHENSQKGKRHPEIAGSNNPNARKVAMVDESNAIIKTYLTLVEASKDTGCSIQAISNCCHGLRATSHGKRWMFIDVDNVMFPKQRRENMKGKNNPSAKAVECFDVDGNFIERFDYAKLGAIKYNLDLSAIIRCCRGKQKTCGGMKWKYAYD